MIKTGAKLVFIFSIFIFVFVLNPASVQAGSYTVSETWVGKITGMVTGDMKIFIKRPPIEGTSFPFKGLLIIEATEIAGGYRDGNLRCTMGGRVKDGALKARLNATVHVGGGMDHMSGTLNGTIGLTQGFGSWNLSHKEGSHYGKWTAEKKDAP